MIIVFIALCVLAVYWLQNRIYEKHWFEGLSTQLEFSDEAVFEGEETSLTEIVENNKFLPLSTLHVKFQIDANLRYKNSSKENVTVSDLCYKHDIFSLMPYNRITRTYRIECAKRGFYGINRVDMTSANIMLQNHFVATQDVSTAIYVYPRLLDARDVDIPFRSIMGALLTRKMTMEDPFEFRGIRDYQPYDPIKNINWKASAKTGDLLVNEFSNTAGQEVRIILNLEDETMKRNYHLLEAAIRMTASLAARFLDAGISVSVRTNAADLLTGEIRSCLPGSDPMHNRSIYEMLARLDLEKPRASVLDILDEELRSSNRQPVSYVLVSYVQRADLQHAFEQRTRRHEGGLWVIPHSASVSDRDISSEHFEIYRWEVQ